MVINGKELSNKILNQIKSKVDQLIVNHCIPTLAIIQIGDDIGSTSYIKQKQIAAEKIGVNTVISHQLSAISPDTLATIIQQNNFDSSVQGIIIQRPVPAHLNKPEILNLVRPDKDVDGFVPGSKFTVPVARAVGEILEEIYKQTYSIGMEISDNNEMYLKWLNSKFICVIGRGDTAGKPIADYLDQLNCTTSIIHQSTPNPEAIIHQADVIISCVGKGYIIDPSTLKPGVILISVGIWRDESGKLHGDYEEAKITQIASFYTPTPGGVGPVNVACLMANLVSAV